MMPTVAGLTPPSENGLTSTIVEATAKAAMKPIAPMVASPCRNGTARGMSEPSTAVAEAKAETIAPMKHSSRAAMRGAPKSATRSPT